MRLICDVDIVNRLLASQNLKKSGRSCHSQLSIGKKTGINSKDGTVYLMICSAKDRNGTKYMLRDNVEQIFGRFISEGKATIRFKDPPKDICLSKSDPLQLKSFLNLVKVGAQGKDLDKVTLSSLSIPSAKKVEKPKTKLVILSRRDYPMTTNFPSSLEQLQVSKCCVKRLDSRILQLKRLQVLNLSENSLKELPDGVQNFKLLREIHLNVNQFSLFPMNLCKPNVAQTLSVLDISHNDLRALPPHICLLKTLVHLKLDHNKLPLLPVTIGRLSRLKFFSASHNELQCLPASFLRLQLESLDMFSNPFSAEDHTPSQENMEFPSLMEVTARAIKANKIAYDEESLHGHLCHYLDSARICWCGSYCFQCAVRYVRRVDLWLLSTDVTAVDLFGRKDAPVESYLCSQRCQQKFQANPYAYWRK